MNSLKEVVVIGGTGAQGIPVVHALANSGRYSVRVLTRNAQSSRAQDLLKLPNVALIQGKQDSQSDLHAAFKGVYGAWVNTDGFTLGEKAELFYGIRAYEIARAEGVQHYVYANIEYALKNAGWDDAYHAGHHDAKGRVGEFILAQGQDGDMKASLLSTGPYLDMLFDGMYVPEEKEDGSFVWANPAKDVGHYSLWLFDNLPQAAGLNLMVATEEISFADVAKTFTEVTGKRGEHQYVPLEQYLPVAEPYPGAYSNWATDPGKARDESFQTWRENFSVWWRYWGEGRAVKRDFDMLTSIHPHRIKSVAEWMKVVGYDGKRKSVLKGLEDRRGA
ncbi:NmrA-like protein [Macrophomina phaseolina MS6]|uniref:NmrA-like protein n=1 Tax=Macrophomina phaseolina (strain MS6) TaxID=1126212 RepID=K2RL98_MACPH|nr:NmrA-like protein [Macrophomina phaseolina MS6]